MSDKFQTPDNWADNPLPPGVTCDRIGAESGAGNEGGLEILQHEKGYRFGLDALLLATDLPELGAAPAGGSAAAPTVVELGAAQGIVSLCVARQWPDVRVVAVERQAALFGLMVQNIARNQLGARVHPVHQDVRDIRAGAQAHALLGAHSAELVVCNPPYFRAGERRPSADQERAEARHELHGGLGDFLDAARYVLKQRGRLKIILPPTRLAELLARAAPTDLKVESMRFFHSRPDTDAYLVESVLRRGGAGELRIRPPLYIYQMSGEYGEEVRRRIGASAQTTDAAGRQGERA